MRILLETDNAIVSYNDSKKTLVVIWSGIAEREEFFLVYNNVLKGFKIFFATTLILDFKKDGNLVKSNLNYLLKQVLPMAAKCGLRKLVLINIENQYQDEICKTLYASSNRFSHRISIENALNFEEAFSKLAV